MATLNSHGMEPQEEAIMDLWDEGLSVPEIARSLGLPDSRVQSVTNNYADNCRSDLWAYHARRASADLARAIAAC
jgi:DNA-directed RNA polymerase specialized sigma24 family protein